MSDDLPEPYKTMLRSINEDLIADRKLISVVFNLIFNLNFDEGDDHA